MFKSSDTLYTNRFLLQVESFIRTHGLIKKDDDILVAVSGGLDSMALLHVLQSIKRFGYSYRLSAININHGTRSEQVYEARLVEKFCKELGVNFITAEIEGLEPDSNFEHLAREKRYSKLYENLGENQKLALAHHIDDSFEWSVLQMFRSSNLKSSIGIPVKRGALIRPFMSVSKAQIKKYIDAFDLPFLEDPTNEQTRFERNYIRSQVSDSFAPRYKNYLYHYVNRQNELARRLGVHINLNKNSQFKIRFFKNEVHIFSIHFPTNLSGLEDYLLRGVNHLSPDGRSRLSGEFKKVLAALENNKKGPMRLGSDVEVYLADNYIFMTTLNYKIKNHPLIKGPRDFESFDLMSFKNLLLSVFETSDLRGLFPMYVVVKKKKFNFEAGKINALWSDYDLHKIDNGHIISAIKLLKYWRRPKNKHIKLDLVFLSAV